MLKACKEGPSGVLSLATARLSDSGDRPGFFQALPTRCLAGVERQGGSGGWERQWKIGELRAGGERLRQPQ